MKPQQGKQTAADGSGPNPIAMVCAFAALVPELALHDPRTFGVRSVLPRAAGAVVVTFFFAIFHPSGEKGPLLVLALALVPLSAFAHACALLRERRGVVQHSRYNGRPWLARLLPVCESRLKRCEPLLVLAAGWGLHHWDHALGAFVIATGVCHGLRVLVAHGDDRIRELDLNDALAEQNVAMRAMNRRRGRR